MNPRALAKAVESSADPRRARHFIELLRATTARQALENQSPDQARILTALLSGSQAAGTLLAAHPEWVGSIEPERLQFARREQGLRKEVAAELKGLLESRDYPSALSRLRQFKQREMLRIAARDLAGLGSVPELIREISDVADVCLAGVWDICLRQSVERFGRPWHQDAEGAWQPTEACLLGMGKLGGQELNYSSDVDVLFVYTEEGHVFKEPPVSREQARAPLAASSEGARRRQAPHAPVVPPLKSLSSHQFFNRLAETVIAEVSRMTPDGMLFRIDLRLRPEGDSGPLTRSLGSYENYYAQWGQTWERMMLMKARCVAGDQSLGAEFVEMIQPFRYPRTINEDVLREIAAIKDRIETEVLRADELDRNVKLGRGGIREVEFLVQAQQLLHVGRQPFLQTSQTLPGLEKLSQYNLLTGDEARELREAYCFLRGVEHRLQMEENLQTHTIPLNRAARERLAKLMGFPSASEFEAARRAHTGAVRRCFNRLLKLDGAAPASDPFPDDFVESSDSWKRLIGDHSFRDVNKAFQVLREFVEGPGYMHVSPRTAELARKLLQRLFALCPKTHAASTSEGSGTKTVLSDPDRVVMRLDSFIEAYGARSVLFELWNSNPSIFEMLVLLFDRSEFLAELAIRTPDMVDELVASGRLRQRKTSEEILRDLRHGLNDSDQHLWLRRYHQTELMRIGLRDILGLADFEQHLQELSALADACLQYGFDVVLRKHNIKRPPFVILGLGKLGGAEIDYGSDLDIIFVTDAKSDHLPKLQRIALEVMDLVSTRTEAGLLFHTDARLRPDGDKGLLVNTLGAYVDYYLRRAQLWEIQSLTRIRPVAGDLKLGERFRQRVAGLTDFSKCAGSPASTPATRKTGGKSAAAASLPACATPDWKRKIHQMRMRIQKERTPAGQDDLAIKTGTGGLVDAEFTAQALCMENGWQEANTLAALERGRTSGALPDAPKLIENYRRLRRLEGILRRWSYEGETVLPDEPAPYYRVSIRCGFASLESFREALAGWRKAIREVYDRVFAV